MNVLYTTTNSEPLMIPTSAYRLKVSLRKARP